jgi:hypothetical protein
MTDTLRRFAPALLTLAAAGLLVSGCSAPGEDVRVTLCKDIVLTETGSGTAIQGADTETRGYEYAAVRVRFSSQGRDGQAVCYYDYNAVEDTAIELSDPLAAYATSPFEVVIDGRKLTRSGLANAVKEAMLKQGRELLDQAKQGIQDAIQR